MIFIFKTYTYHIPIRLSIRAGWKTLMQGPKNTQALSQVIFVRFVLFCVMFLAETLNLSPARFQTSSCHVVPLWCVNCLRSHFEAKATLHSNGQVTLKSLSSSLSAPTNFLKWMLWGTAPCNALGSQDVFGNENTKRLDLKPHHPYHKKCQIIDWM